MRSLAMTSHGDKPTGLIQCRNVRFLQVSLEFSSPITKQSQDSNSCLVTELFLLYHETLPTNRSFSSIYHTTITTHTPCKDIPLKKKKKWVSEIRNQIQKVWMFYFSSGMETLMCSCIEAQHAAPPKPSAPKTFAEHLWMGILEHAVGDMVLCSLWQTPGLCPQIWQGKGKSFWWRCIAGKGPLFSSRKRKNSSLKTKLILPQTGSVIHTVRPSSAGRRQWQRRCWLVCLADHLKQLLSWQLCPELGLGDLENTSQQRQIHHIGVQVDNQHTSRLKEEGLETQNNYFKAADVLTCLVEFVFS